MQWMKDNAGGDAVLAAADRYRIATDLRLLLGEQVHLNAFGLKGRLTGGVRLLAPPDEVARSPARTTATRRGA